MEVLSAPVPTNKYGQYGRSQSAYDIQDAQHAIWDRDRTTQGVNKKLMRLAVDSRSKRQSLMYDESMPRSRSSTLLLRDDQHDGSLQNLKITQFHDCDNARFPRMEAMSHFHYNNVDFHGTIDVSLCIDDNEDISELDTGQGLLVEVTAKEKSWIIKRSIEDFIGLDRQIHRCLYDRRYSLLSVLGELELEENLTADMVHKLQEYLSRFSKLAGNNVNCGPILNWLELDNHGNHLVVMEADDSAINVPAIAAGRVMKRYQAQAADEITLEVGEFLSVIDMPPVEETIWWRGKKGYEVGFFPSHCIEILGEKDVTGKVIGDLNSRPVSKRRGKFITFLRFFFKSRPSKDELMQNGILRERVFGCDLGERLALCGRDVPLVLTMCSQVIEEYGIVDGIYRLSGILSNLQRLRVAFDNDDHPPNLLDPRYLNDIHCISSLLKTYFRELPNPLFTFELYDKFVAAINKDDDTEKTVAFHHVIQRLPPPHYRTMNILLRHLNHCASQAKETNMTAKNLAIVWAPNLLRPNMEDSVGALAEFRTQAIIVEYMIRNVDVFFNSTLASAAIAYYPESVDNTSEDTTSRPSSVTTNMGGAKLISLEEARQRVLHNRLGSESSTDETAINSPRHKLRASIQPPRMAAAPISPLPTLLSLEEAQARTKVNLNVNRRGSADLIEIRDASSNDSPKRNKKWFGLFSKSRSVVDDDVSKNPVYRKKGSTRRDVTISSPAPTPTPSETKLEVDQGGSSECLVKPTGRKDNDEIASSMQLDDDFDSRMSPDPDDLMSAIVSVTAKYTTVKDSHKSSHRRSVTIGEPSEFRRLNYIASYENDANKSMDEKLCSTDIDANDAVINPVVLNSETYSYEMISACKPISQELTKPDPASESDRKPRSCREPMLDNGNNVPAKKIRSFSPETFSNPPMNEVTVTGTSKIHLDKGVDTFTNTVTSKKEEEMTGEASPKTSKENTANIKPLAGTGEPSVYPSVERTGLPNVDSKQCIETDQSVSRTPNSETIFQLVAVPRVEQQTNAYGVFDVNEQVTDSSTEICPFSSIPKALRNQAVRLEEASKEPEVSPPTVVDTIRNSNEKHETTSEPSVAVKAIEKHIKTMDQKYKIRQLSRTPDDKIKVDVPLKTTDKVVRSGYVDTIQYPKHNDFNENENDDNTSSSSSNGNNNDITLSNALVSSTLTRLKSDFSFQPNDPNAYVFKSYGGRVNDRCKSTSEELINDTVTTSTVSRSYSLSVKDKVNLFSNSDNSRTPLNVDLRSLNGDKDKSKSAELCNKDHIRSTPNLYLHTEYSARPSPTSLNCEYINNQGKECENCENNRRSNSHGACSEHRKSNRQNNIGSNSNNNRYNSRDERTVNRHSSGDLLPVKRLSKSERTIPVTEVVTSNVYRKKEHTRPPMKPRPLSDSQKRHSDYSPSVVNVDRKSQDLNDYKYHRTSVLASVPQSPFFSLLQKSISDNYLDDDTNGKLIGRFPLTLKNGSSVRTRSAIEKNSIHKKRDSRPLSMYDNIHQSYYDNLSTARYDLV